MCENVRNILHLITVWSRGSRIVSVNAVYVIVDHVLFLTVRSAAFCVRSNEFWWREYNICMPQRELHNHMSQLCKFAAARFCSKWQLMLLDLNWLLSLIGVTPSTE
jgi:hypothetical protein